MKNKIKLSILATLVTAIFLISIVGMTPGAATNPSTTPLHTNISLNGVDLNAFTSAVSTNNPLISGNNFQFGYLPSGFTFLANTSNSNIYTTANVGTMTLISDSALFANLAANPAYNMEFLNGTFNAISYASNDPSHNFVGTAPTVTTTSVTAAGYSNGTAITGTYTSQLANKLLATDTYTSAGAVSYLPMSNNNFWLILNLFATGGSSSDTASVVVNMKTNGANFPYTLTLHNTTGTTGYTLTTSGVTFNAYSAFGNHITMAIPIAQSWTDSATALVFQGIASTQLLIHSADSTSANKVSIQCNNIAIQSQLPALTTNVNTNGYYKYKDSTNSLPVNPWEGEDIIQTSISGPTSTTYDNNMPLLANIYAKDGNFASLVPFQQLHFQGQMSVLPTTQSDVSSGKDPSGNGYVTAEIVTFSTASINPVTNSFYKFADLSNIFSVTSWYFNVTLSNLVLDVAGSTNYGVAFVTNSFTVNSNPTTAYNNLWTSVSVGINPTDARYAITGLSLTTGTSPQSATYSLSFYTLNSYNSVATNSAGSGSGSGNSSMTSQTNTYIIIAGFAVVVGLFVVWHKKKR